MTRSEIFKLANALRWNEGLTQSEALTKAWKVAALKAALKAGKVEFSYTKKDGSHRPATGTTNSAFFQYERKTDRPTPRTLVTYFDVEANAFRSFHAKNIN